MGNTPVLWDAGSDPPCVGSQVSPSVPAPPQPHFTPLPTWPGQDCISSCLWFTGPVIPDGTTPAQRSSGAPRARCWDPSQCRAWRVLTMLCSGHSRHTRSRSLRRWSLAAFFHSRSRRFGAVPDWGHSGERESPSETLRGSQASLLFCSEKTQQFPVPNLDPSYFYPPLTGVRARVMLCHARHPPPRCKQSQSPWSPSLALGTYQQDQEFELFCSKP